MNKKPRHTPGPWSVRENENGTLGIDAKEPDGTPCQPARINGDATDPVLGPVTRANARLIAAAPDLLECLKRAIENCDCTIAQRESGHCLECWAPTAQQAVDRAEGRTS